MKRKTTDERMRAAAAKAKPSEPPESWIICSECKRVLSSLKAYPVIFAPDEVVSWCCGACYAEAVEPDTPAPDPLF